MYVPRINEVTDWSEIAAFIRANSFGLLISNDHNNLPIATHIPMLLEDNQHLSGSRLIGHVAKTNQQQRTFTEEQTCLAIFMAPHAYISSSWYHSEKIPTWNYMAVHVYGKLTILSEDALEQSLRQLMAVHEAGENAPVHFDDINYRDAKANMKAIVGFALMIEKVEARFKLSQNKDAADYHQIISHLQARKDGASHFIANEMTKREKQE